MANNLESVTIGTSQAPQSQQTRFGTSFENAYRARTLQARTAFERGDIETGQEIMSVLDTMVERYRKPLEFVASAPEARFDEATARFASTAREALSGAHRMAIDPGLESYATNPNGVRFKARQLQMNSDAASFFEMATTAPGQDPFAEAVMRKAMSRVHAVSEETPVAPGESPRRSFEASRANDFASYAMRNRAADTAWLAGFSPEALSGGRIQLSTDDDTRKRIAFKTAEGAVASHLAEAYSVLAEAGVPNEVHQRIRDLVDRAFPDVGSEAVGTPDGISAKAAMFSTVAQSVVSSQASNLGLGVIEDLWEKAVSEMPRTSFRGGLDLAKGAAERFHSSVNRMVALTQGDVRLAKQYEAEALKLESSKPEQAAAYRAAASEAMTPVLGMDDVRVVAGRVTQSPLALEDGTRRAFGAVAELRKSSAGLPMPAELMQRAVEGAADAALGLNTPEAASYIRAAGVTSALSQGIRTEATSPGTRLLAEYLSPLLSAAGLSYDDDGKLPQDPHLETLELLAGQMFADGTAPTLSAARTLLSTVYSRLLPREDTEIKREEIGMILQSVVATKEPEKEDDRTTETQELASAARRLRTRSTEIDAQTRAAHLAQEVEQAAQAYQKLPHLMEVVSRTESQLRDPENSPRTAEEVDQVSRAMRVNLQVATDNAARSSGSGALTSATARGVPVDPPYILMRRPNFDVQRALESFQRLGYDSLAQSLGVLENLKPSTMAGDLEEQRIGQVIAHLAKNVRALDSATTREILDTYVAGRAKVRLNYTDAKSRERAVRDFLRKYGVPRDIARPWGQQYATVSARQ